MPYPKPDGLREMRSRARIEKQLARPTVSVSDKEAVQFELLLDIRELLLAGNLYESS